jgi:cation:H+ antiporter
MVTGLILVLGLGVLIKGADWLIQGATTLAKKFKVPDIVIGLTVVALGTSLAELFVNIMASFSGTSDVAMGNILGSNNVNVLLILGLAAVIYPLKVKNNTIWKEIPLCILAAVLVFVLTNDTMFNQYTFNELSKTDGVVLLSFFGVFLYYTYYLAKNSEPLEEWTDIKTDKSAGRALFHLGTGLVCLVVGAKMVVASAVTLATHLGVSEALIGLTIVAVGTSLPELATSVVASVKKNADIAVGNIVGSNIFNIFFILGISALIRPLSYNLTFNKDAILGIAASVLMFFFMFTGQRRIFDRWEGVLFVMAYLAYTVYLVKPG